MLVVAATERELACVDAEAPAVRLVSGIGPIEAAAATAAAIAKNPRSTASGISVVLNIGLAGAQGFERPRLVIGTSALYCDAVADFIPRALEPDPGLLAAAQTAWPDALATAIGTSARVGGTTGCDIEAMEGFGVLRACALARVPALEIRVTSNEISEPDRSLWRFDDALDLLRAHLPVLIEALDA